MYGTTTRNGPLGHGTVYRFFPGTYAWSITNGSIIGPTNTPSIQWTAANTGLVTITVIVSDSPVCVTTNSTTVISYKGGIAAGGNSSLALRPDGTSWAWGDGSDGRSGDQKEHEDPRPFPVEVADPTSCFGQTIGNVVALAGGGESFTVVADANGRVWTWGGSFDDDSGGIPLLGDGGSRSNLLNQNFDLLVPSPITGVSNVVSVAAGYEHTLALRADGTVWAWGNDNLGQLGIGPSAGSTNSPAQSQIPAQAAIVAIAAGSFFSLALDASGNVWGWGYNSGGQLGTGVSPGGTTNIPTLVQGISNVVAVAAGFDHTMALTADKTVWTWGNNDRGQLGRSGTITTPGQVPNLGNVVAIAGGYQFSLAVTTNGNGRVYAWGDNSNGQLGTNTNTGSLTSPHLVAGISNAVLVSASLISLDRRGAFHSLAMTVDQGTNRYWGWGENDYGQVGNGTDNLNNVSGDNNVYTPAQVQFCTRCQRCVQLGTSGILTAQCTGTLKVYFNDDVSGYTFSSGAYTVAVSGVTNNLPVPGNAADGIAVCTVTNGGVYTYSASGLCYSCDNNTNCWTDADGKHGGILADCSSINITNSICPAAHCFSLVGKIQ